MDEEIKYYTVSQYNKSIKNYFDSIPELRDVHIKGEISNYKCTKGNYYFTLKDEKSRMSAIMFASVAGNLTFDAKDGDEVLVDGRIAAYEASGVYQVYVNKMTLAGNGDLLKKFEELKKKLSDEGLFDQKYKKAIPRYPEKIGIVTAPTGAAIKDILSTIKRRFPICETILFPALVQGELAKDDIVKQIKRAQDYDLDLLIVGRGGGSIEDLWAFNEECVARAIFASEIPIISAVGHEPDVTISDYVADLRAPTPTGAAEMAVPNMHDLFIQIDQTKIRLNKNISNKIEYLAKNLKNLSGSYVLSNPLATFEIKMQKLDSIYEKITSYIKYKIDTNKSRLDNVKKNKLLNNPTDMFVKTNNQLELYINKLELLNPLNVLSKGYSVVKLDDKIIKNKNDVKIDDKLKIKLLDGELTTIVKEVN